MKSSENMEIARPDSSRDLEERISLLKEIPFFQNLDPDKLAKIGSSMKARTFTAGAHVLEQDQPVDGAYFLQSGEIQVLVSNEQTGQEELITHGYKGECFGEMSTLRGEIKASATILATRESQFLYLGREDFLKIVNELNLWQEFVKVLASRLEHTNHRMTEVMKHLKQGMVQVDTKGVITGKFSMGFVRIMGAEPNEIHGQSFSEMVFANAPDAVKKWKDNFSLAVMSDPDQAELILSLLPEECLFNHKELGERLFRISYDLCVYQSHVVGMDIGLEDITRVRELASKSKELEKEKGIIKEIYTKPETFRTLLSLLDEVKSDLESAGSMLKQDKIYSEEVRVWFGRMHSLKGNSNFLNMELLGLSAHQMENTFSIMTKTTKVTEEIRDSFYLQKEDLLKHISYVSDILSGMSEETRKRLTADLIMSEKEALKLEDSLNNNYVALELLQTARKTPSHMLVEGWKEELQKIGAAHSKKIVFRIMGETVGLPAFICQRIKLPLVHLLRNCAEHGIETIESRKKKRKPSAGLITFEAAISDNRYYLHIQDNGKGISKEEILRKAQKVSLRDPVLATNIDRLIKEERFLAILFLPGFSTSENVTTLSGRGVGLDVVQRAAADAGGTISMKTLPGKGTKFTLTFPLKI